MTLREYFEQFQGDLTGKPDLNFTMQVAAEVAAAYSIGLTFEQLKLFLARRTEITSVASLLTGPTLSVEVIERILEARSNGAVHPKEVLEQSFAKEEVHEKFRADIYGSSNA